jgi:hypothetical protein
MDPASTCAGKSILIGMLRAEAMRMEFPSVRILARNLPSVADRVQIQQVLMNLMLNGIEAMHDTGRVLTVKSQSEDGQIQIAARRCRTVAYACCFGCFAFYYCSPGALRRYGAIHCRPC